MENLVDEAKRALELASKATPGPWQTDAIIGTDDYDDPDTPVVIRPGQDQFYVPFEYGLMHDAEFMAASRELMPKLAEAVIELSESPLGRIASERNLLRVQNSILKTELSSANAKVVIAEEALERIKDNASSISIGAVGLKSPAIMAMEALQKIRGEK